MIKLYLLENQGMVFLSCIPRCKASVFFKEISTMSLFFYSYQPICQPIPVVGFDCVIKEQDNENSSSQH